MDKDLKVVLTEVKDLKRVKKFTSKYVYLLDPGHGGIDPLTKQYVTPGKRSPKLKNGTVIYEGVAMRSIVKYIGEMLSELGISFHFVVQPENYKDVDLPSRVRFCNLMHKTAKCILISVHSNAHGNGTVFTPAHGFEVFTSPGKTNSDAFAQIIIEEYGKSLPSIKLRADTSDGDHDKEAKFTMLTGPKCPAMLIETLFHTNEKEVELLKTTEGQKSIARAIVNGIKKIEGL